MCHEHQCLQHGTKTPLTAIGKKKITHNSHYMKKHYYYASHAYRQYNMETTLLLFNVKHGYCVYTT